MKIVNVLGGLGNQLFQYAFAIALKDEFPDEIIKINTFCFNGYPLHNGFELDKLFKIEIPFASKWDMCRIAYPWFHYRLWQIGRRILPNRKRMAWDRDYKMKFNFNLLNGKSYFDGYWQSPKFFERHKDTIVKAFSFPTLNDSDNLKALNFIQSKKTAFIHVRRGDYMNHPIYGGICTLSYYTEAIQKLRTKGYHRFIIFSNDITWCSENLIANLKDNDILFADWNTNGSSYKDMQLMSYCNAGIIANSSFSWWGAWLGDLDTVICPDKWTRVVGHREDIYPEKWIKIKV
ncbi:MAG: alpha-1,2-fucosyltransferase [Paramuribaculum sp.]|nr:alpha-1,2-fucosyltransferase [Paramuribaculum sp.]